MNRRNKGVHEGSIAGVGSGDSALTATSGKGRALWEFFFSWKNLTCVLVCTVPCIEIVELAGFKPKCQAECFPWGEKLSHCCSC